MSTTTQSPASFMSVSQFKTATQSDKLEVVFNKKTSKLSVLADGADFYKCQQNIDTSKPMAFLIPDGVIEDACLVNVKNESPLTIKATL